jgi:hypothetical protein
VNYAGLPTLKVGLFLTAKLTFIANLSPLKCLKMV